MSFSVPSQAPIELKQLCQFLNSLPFDDGQAQKIQEHIDRLSERFEVQRNSLEFLTKNAEELSHHIKYVLFDLSATQMERDALIEKINP
ncbi:MAG: hypothetical protein ACI4QC_00190 [Thermoguttaceae bacterium]